jgi:hypothetical protein
MNNLHIFTIKKKVQRKRRLFNLKCFNSPELFLSYPASLPFGTTKDLKLRSWV